MSLFLFYSTEQWNPQPITISLPIFLDVLILLLPIAQPPNYCCRLGWQLSDSLEEFSWSLVALFGEGEKTNVQVTQKNYPYGRLWNDEGLCLSQQTSLHRSRQNNGCQVSTVTARCHWGDVVGSGYHSQVKQLQVRIENAKRSSASTMVKCKWESDGYDTEEIPAEKRAAVQDTYGCIKWDMKFMPVSETTHSQQEKKLKMKLLIEQANFSPDEVKTLKETFLTSVDKRENGF